MVKGLNKVLFQTFIVGLNSVRVCYFSGSEKTLLSCKKSSFKVVKHQKVEDHLTFLSSNLFNGHVNYLLAWANLKNTCMTSPISMTASDKFFAVSKALFTLYII